jgi:hypothetical protein
MDETRREHKTWQHCQAGPEQGNLRAALAKGTTENDAAILVAEISFLPAEKPADTTDIP